MLFIFISKLRALLPKKASLAPVVALFVFLAATMLLYGVQVHKGTDVNSVFVGEENDNVLPEIKKRVESMAFNGVQFSIWFTDGKEIFISIRKSVYLNK